MITMEMLGKIRRLYLRDKLSLHEITKRTGLSRNTIRRWLRSPKGKAPPQYRRREGRHKLSAFCEAVEQALKADSHRNKQNRRTAKALFAQIKADGYAGGYSQLTAFIRGWRGREGQAPHAFVPLKFELGEAFQFDWSEEGLVVGGIYRRMQVSHLKLWDHGNYDRKANRISVGKENMNPIPIPRYLCAGCERTCSRVPECIAPRRWYNWIVQAVYLRAVMRETQPEGEASASSHPTRRTIQRWWNWLRECGPVFRFHLSSRFAELGRLGGELDYWCHVVDTMGLSRAMAFVNQEMRIP